MEKRVLLALAISFLVLGFYPVILQKFYPQSAKTSPTASLEPLPSSPASGNLKGSDLRGAVSPAFLGDTERLLQEEDLAIGNERVKAVFNKKGGLVREISFPRFADPKTQEGLKFLSADSSGSLPGLVSLSPDGMQFKEALTGYQAEERPGEILFVPSSDADGVRIVKSWRLEKDSYASRLEIRLENASNAPKELYYQLFVGPSIAPRHSIDSQYIEANFYSDVDGKKVLQHPKESKRGKVVTSQGKLEWAATKDRHFSIIFKPLSGTFKGAVQGLGNHEFQVFLLSEKIALPAGGAIQHDFLVYHGPNDIQELLPQGLDPIVNFGKLDLFGKLLVGGLELLHKVFRNYGIAIIALTTLINVLLFPLTRVSYLSMKRMQLVQPKVNQLRQQHGKNPEKMNRELMELYKKHKVNPFGGCLPMLLQMPVFVALYVALSKSVALLNEGLLWIRDLSLPDSVQLPMALPLLGKEAHLLPLIMVGAMVIQQKFTQVKMEGQDPSVEMQQKMMAVLMPIVFGFVFYSMPSGLVLYWLTNTLLMTVYQLRLKSVTLT
ncbi:MAG: membrane protein insertase YidC [Candidatus Omnitrophica bacterium]|nr:membrane protein insertase YidC [Candidatus Omnitrophota bacterium]